MRSSVAPRAALASILIICTCLAMGCGGADARKARHFARGQAYLAEGKLEKAGIEFRNVLQITPNDAASLYEMGVVEEKMGKVNQAAKHYQSAIDIDPQQASARAHLGRLFALSGMPDRALETIKPALEKQPDSAELLTVRASVRSQQRDYAAAKADAERAVELDPSNNDAVALLAAMYMNEASADKAEALLRTSIVKSRDPAELRLILAQLYGAQGRLDLAEKELRDLVAHDPSSRAHRIRLAQFYERQDRVDAAEQTLRDGVKDNPKDDPLKLALVAMTAARRGLDAGQKVLLDMIAAEPRDFDLKFALARLYERGGKPELAEKLYHDVIDIEQFDGAGLAARNHLADLRVTKGDTASALELLAEVLDNSPRNDDALILRGNLALAKGDPKAAIADLRAVLRDEPDSAPVLRTLARAHIANGQPDIAEETLRHALDAAPSDPDVKIDLAGLLAERGFPEQAKPLFEQLVKDFPDNTFALEGLIRVSFQMGELAAAKSAADSLVAVAPKAAAGYFAQGILAQQAHHADEALRLYAKAVDLQPELLDSLEAQVRLLILLKRVPEALQRLDAVAAAAPKTPYPPLLKGDLLISLGRASEARPAYESVIERAPKRWQGYRGLANTQFAANDPKAALITLRKGMAVADQPDQLALDIATYHERTGQIDDAKREYEEILKVDPQFEAAANNLAMLLATYRTDAVSLDRAKSLVTRFADSANPNYLDTYGWVLYKRGETAASLPVLEKAVAKVPNAAECRYHLGMVLALSGNNEEARENLAKAVDSGAKFAGLDEARATLDRLTKARAQHVPNS